MNNITEEIIKEFRHRFYGSEGTNEFIDSGEVEVFLLESIKKVREEVARDCLDIAHSSQDKSDAVIAFKLGYSGARFDITEAIAKKYKLYEKYKLKEVKP